MTNATRLDAIIATFVGTLALLVSGYTAFIQRQQVRAQVLPLVQLNSGWSDDDVHMVLQNKGMGPAQIRDVRFSFNGKPMHGWDEVIAAALGPGEPRMAYSDFGRYVLGAAESLEVLKFHGLKPAPPGAPPAPVMPDQQALDTLARSRGKMDISICYCSTLGDCWTLHEGPGVARTDEVPRCPESTKDSFN